jgi:EAL domain-containing protein (putative c-di-GMP-specific phosphodiesterase class I)
MVIVGGKAPKAAKSAKPQLKSPTLKATLADIRGGLDAYEFEPFFQPIVRLADGCLAGFEALARWRHPERGLVAPVEFVGPAEEHGLIRAIDGVILDRAWRSFDDALESTGVPGASMMLSVNLSTEHLLDTAIVDTVRALTTGARAGASKLQFEITETLLIDNREDAEIILNQLKQLGVSIALDDFGTGYSSLVYLHHFPIDCIKIDRSFSKEILKSPRSLAIVRSIVSLAQSMGLRTVAEGIEEKEVAEKLLTLGCHYGQGLHFGAPIPATDLVEWLKNSRLKPD